MKYLMLAALLTLATYPAHAADFTYAPKGCEFRMAFPEEPASGRTCSKKKPDQCRDSAVFNKIYDMESGIHITVTCNDAEPGMMKKYSGDIMKYTIGAMAKEHVDEGYETAFQEFPYAKQALIMGSKKQADGREDIYMAQLWIGKKSVFTIEGEVTGGQLPEADALFARIMKSINHESVAAAPAKAAEKAPETPAAPQKSEAEQEPKKP